jgi:hypothetical protein
MLEFLSKINDLIVSSSNEVSGLITSSSNEYVLNPNLYYKFIAN